MTSNRTNRLYVGNAQICMVNFRGEERRNKRTGEIVNAEGDRNFCIRLDPDKAKELRLAGWNVKPYFSVGNEERLVPDFEYLPVTVEFKQYPPNIYVISGNKKTKLDEDLIGDLQGKEFENIDLVINPYHWQRGNNSGIKAYLYKGWFTLLLDEFDQKYAHLDEDEDIPFEPDDPSDQAANW